MNKEIFEFEEMSSRFDKWLSLQLREIVIKGFIKSNIGKSLKIFVRSNDHGSPHFHIKSDQRDYSQKFSVKSLENISKVKDHRFDSHVLRFFKDKKELLCIIENKFHELNPELR